MLFVVSTASAQKRQLTREEYYAKGNITNDVRRIFDEDNSVQTFLNYARDNNVPMTNMIALLKWFVLEGTDKEPVLGPEPLWCWRAINMMGSLRLKECVPFLREISQRTRKETCIASIIQIGGDDALEFAKDVIANTNCYNGSHRYMLYNQIIRHTWEEEPWLVTPVSPEERAKFVSFYLSEPNRNEKIGHAANYDKEWSRLHKGYRLSVQRENLLRNFAAETPSPHRDYFSQQLEVLKKEREKDAKDAASTNSPSIK
jgi:hypothetical protein